MKRNKVKILIVLDIVILVCAVVLVIAALTQNDEKERAKTQVDVSASIGGSDKSENNDKNTDGNESENDQGNESETNSEIEQGNVSEDGQADKTEEIGTGTGTEAEAGQSNGDGNESGEEPGKEQGSSSETVSGIESDREPEEIIDLPVAASYKEGLSKLSTKKVGWCFERKKNNEPSGTYEPFDIEPYGAYYLNKDVEEGDKVIYFSFDCGYEYGYTAKIMDTLKKHGIKATFFVTKSFLDTDAELAKRMKEEGHIVGNHTLNHPSLPEKDADRVYEEVHGMEQLFKEKTGYELDKFIRPPMGEYSESVLKELQNMGYTTIFWSIAYGDYDVNNQPGKEYVVDHFKKYHHNGAITLTHTVSSSNTEALDDVLTYLEDQGYRFGSLAELRAKSVE